MQEMTVKLNSPKMFAFAKVAAIIGTGLNIAGMSIQAKSFFDDAGDKTRAEHVHEAKEVSQSCGELANRILALGGGLAVLSFSFPRKKD